VSDGPEVVSSPPVRTRLADALALGGSHGKGLADGGAANPFVRQEVAKPPAAQPHGCGYYLQGFSCLHAMIRQV
jgi:hypothetical protein